MTNIIIGRVTKDQILSMIEANCDEPVTGNEIYLAQKRHLKKAFSTVHRALQELVLEGTLITRFETVTERPEGLRGTPALLYWPASKGTLVPTRQTDTQFPGVTRQGAVGVELRNRKSKARHGKKFKMQTAGMAGLTRRPGKASDVQTGNRIERLEKRIADLESTIASLRKILN